MNDSGSVRLSVLVATQTDPASSEAGSFMQTAYWARFKSLSAWTPYFFSLDYDGRSERLLVLVRSLKAGLHFAYIPFAPSMRPDSSSPAEFLETLGSSILSAIPRKLLFIRFDLPWEVSSPAALALEEELSQGKAKLKKGSSVQVPDTVVLDLHASEEEILSSMKPKWRYNIRLAEKKGVVVRRQGEEAIPAFYELYKTTAARDGIGIHPQSYYQDLFEAVKGEGSPDISVWTATLGNETLASIITLFSAGEAVYLYGASSDEKRNLMPAYALQWAAIRAAKSEGCHRYDFFGIPPDEDPDHPMAGLYRFKTGFGGRQVHRVGSIDFPVSSVGYHLFSMLEHGRLFWFKRVKKLLAGKSVRTGGSKTMGNQNHVSD